MINKIVDGISKAINKEFGNNYEIYTELATKNILGKLEPNEKELFKFLGGDI